MFVRRAGSGLISIIGLTLLLGLAGGVLPARASTVFNQVHTIAADTTAVPVEETFSVTTAGTYTITLTDLGAALTPPAPLSSVELAVTDSNDTVVGNPLVGAGTLTLGSLAAGSYQLHVVGMPGSAPGSGPIGIQVNGPGATQLATFQDTLALPAQPLPNGEGALADSFTVASSGNYTVTLTDLELPQSLTTLTLLLIAQGGAAPTAILPVPGSGALQTTVALTTGVTYEVFAVGVPGAPAGAGLYGVVVTASGGSVVYGRAIPAGSVSHVGSAALAAGSATLAVTDLKYPAALTQLQGVATLSGQAAVQLTASGQQSFTAQSATYEVFTYGAAATAAPAAGSYAVELTQGGAAALATARAVSASGSSQSTYDFDTTIATAGAYTLTLTDFQFPAALNSLGLAVVQGGALLGTPLAAAGNVNVNAAAGPISILVLAQSATAGGLFGIQLAPQSGGGAAVFGTTQAVGTLFSAQQITITGAGSYAVTATDLAFPASFANYDTIVTQGATQVGSIFGGGTFNFAATPGTYYVNFIAQPAGPAQAGTYALTVATAPAPPVVNLSVDNPTVSSGSSVDLTWSTQNATSCTASGGWNGSEPLSGTATSATLTADTTFTLSCTGAGGTVNQSVKVTVTPASSGGGGGGTIDPLLLAVLTLLPLGRFLQRTGARLPKAAPATAAVMALAVAASLGLGGCGGAQSRFDAHMQRGQEHFTAGDYTHASVEFRNAMQIEPRNAAARVMAARTYEKLSRLREALGLFQSAVDIAPDNIEARANLARLLIAAGGADPAMKTLEPALKVHPEDPLLLTLRGAAEAQLGRPDAAIADVDHALRLDPTNLGAVEARAGLYRHAGDLAAATALIDAAVRRQPDSTELHEALADLDAAAGEPGKAEGELRTLVTLAPRDTHYRYQLAAFLVHAQRLDDAQQVLQEAVQALPKNDDVKLALVEFVSTQRTRAQGEQLLRNFITHDPDNFDLRLALGRLLERSEATREAIAAYEDVVQRDGTGIKGLIARDRLARIAWTQGRQDDAARLTAQVLESSPRDLEAQLLHGEMALAHDNPPAAITDFRAVLRDQPQAVRVSGLLATALVENGQAALADEQLRGALEIAPDDLALRVERARVLLQLQRADEAAALLEDCVQRAPADVAVREQLATAYLAKRDYTAARAAAEEVVRLRPQAGAGPYLAGLAAEGAGHNEEAQRELKRALELQPRSYEALSALARLMLSRGQVAQAVATVAGAAGQGPPDARTLNLLGEMQLAQRDFPAATDAFARASAVVPAWWIPYRNLALARIGAHDEPGAVAAYRSAIKAAPAETQPVTELALYYEGHGRSADAIALYQDWHRRNPQSQLVANNLAMLLVRYRTDQASLDEARDLTAPFSASSDGNLLDTNGWVHFKRAEYAQALPVLQRAVEQAPGSREFRYHLGMAEWRSGNPSGARKDLEAALSGAAKFSGADEARAALATLGNSSG